MKIVLPKTFCEIDPDYGPLFFLAGPVRGGNDWQKKCCEEIQKILPHFYAAIPYYFSTLENYPLRNLGIPGKEGVFSRQLNWERHYLDHAAKNGCLIFWLPEESKTNPRTPEEGPYATDTRGEIARWSVELKYNPTYRIVVGAEKGFPNLSQIDRNFSADQKTSFPFYKTLAVTVREAVRKTGYKTIQ